MYRVILGFVITIKVFLVICQVSAAANQFQFDSHTENNRNQPILVFESAHNYTQTIEHVRRAINGMNFILIKELNLDDGFDRKSGNSRERIIYFCNFDRVNKAIKHDYRVGQFLPCRITVMEVAGKVYVSAINPKSISQLLHNIKLNQICDEMYDMYIALLSEATF